MGKSGNWRKDPIIYEDIDIKNNSMGYYIYGYSTLFWVKNSYSFHFCLLFSHIFIVSKERMSKTKGTNNHKYKEFLQNFYINTLLHR